MERLPLVVLATLSLLLPSCGGDKTPYSIRIKGTLPSSSNPVFMYRDKPIKYRQDGDTMILELETTGGVKLTGDINSVSVKLETPCGELKLPVFFGQQEQEALLAAENKRVGKRIEGKAALDVSKGADPLIINIDRRDDAGAPLTVGTLKLDPAKAIPAKGSAAERMPGEMYEIIRPSCDEGNEVRLGDEKIGRIGFTQSGAMARAPGVALVDAKGGHCYEVTQFFYAPGGGEPPVSAKLGGERVYTFPYAAPDKAFLAECPDRLNRETCIQLHPVSCR